VPYREVPAYYRRATLVVNTSLTGSLDKVVLEAMAMGRPVVTCNEAVLPLFAELGPDAELLGFEPGNAAQLAERIEALLALTQAERDALGARLRAIAARDHEVDALMRRLVAEMGGAEVSA
jgi:glycosyltransferase involved in cell wall biosynthesis